MSIDKDKGASLITKTPMKESEMSPERQHHREAVRVADKKKEMAGKMKSKIGESKFECNICSKTTKHTHFK